MGQFYRPGIALCRLVIRCGLIAYIYCILSRGVALRVGCPPGWTHCPQSGTCLKPSFDKKSWYEAIQDCRRKGGDLVKILDRKMNDWLVKHFLANRNQKAKNKLFYTGLWKPAGKRAYNWLNETSEAVYKGNGNRKIVTQYDQCLMTYIDPKNRALWFSTDCTQHHFYICEKIPVKLCPEDFYPNSNAGTCIKVVYQTMSWHKARAHCQTLGGDLAVILDDKVDQFLSDQTGSKDWRFRKFVWIGLNDIGSRGNFKWLDNFVDGVNYTNWKENQPDSHSESNCVKLSQSAPSKTPYWDDTDCNEELPFICEKFADCEYEQYGMFCPKSCTSPFCADEPDACNRRNGICQNACSKSRYGENCLKTCSPHCGGLEKACHIRHGSCFSGCEDGYKGVRCETECNSHTYGANCLKACSPHCGGQEKTCHYRDGSCLFGCADGYTGLRCEAECSNYTYGPNCSKACSPHCGGQNKTCDHRDGSCLSGCADGYTGLHCETQCSNYTYGTNCSKACSPHCGGQNKTCDHRDGSCLSGCADGYTDLRCETVCSKHFYGANCSKVCSPYCGGQNKPCDHINGSCLSGCADGYTGLRCETTSEDIKSTRRPRPKYTTAAIVSATIFASVIFLTCSFLWFMIKETENEQQEMSTLEEEQHMRLDENTAQVEYMSEDESLADDKNLPEDKNMAADENLTEDENLAEDEYMTPEKNMAPEGYMAEGENM